MIPDVLVTAPQRIVLQQNPHGPPEPRMRMACLVTAFGPPGSRCSQEEMDALMVLTRRIVASIPSGGRAVPWRAYSEARGPRGS